MSDTEHGRRVTYEVSRFYTEDARSLSGRLKMIREMHPDATQFSFLLHKDALEEMIQMLDKAEHLYATVRNLVDAVHVERAPEGRGLVYPPDSQP